MAATLVVDTLRLARGLEAAGFPPNQAQGAAGAIADAIAEAVATRSDLRELELRLGARVEEVRLEVDKARLELDRTRLELEKQISESRLILEAKLIENKTDITRWVFGAVTLQTFVLIGAVPAILKLLPQL